MTSIGILRLPPAIHFGIGSSESLSAILRPLGNKIFAVVDPFLSTTPSFEQLRTTLELQGFDLEVYTAFTAELPYDDVQEAAVTCRQYAPDVVLGYGGGSALDAAKLVSLLATHGGILRDYYGENRIPAPLLPVVAVPTTAGTGSEVTPVAVVSDPAQELKVGISSPFLIPHAAVVDPSLTLGSPRPVAAFAGIDAFVHAVESFTAAPLDFSWTAALPVFAGHNVLTAELSLAAMRQIYLALPAVVDDPSDVTARTEMSHGSLLAGMAFGSTGTHLSHAIQYPIGALTKTPHGLGTGMMLPYVLQACLPSAAPRLAQIARALPGVRIDTDDEVVLAQRAVDAIAALCVRIGLPGTLQDIGVTREQLPRICSLTLRVGRLVAIAPLEVDRDLVDRILAAAFVGDRSLLLPAAAPLTD